MAQNLELFASNYEIKPSPYQNYFPMMKTAFAFVLFFAISLPLSKPLSRDAIPGEALYPVKIIHEEITAASIGKADKKIDFEIERTEKRIQEAVILAEKSELDPIKQVEIANEIKEQVKSISKKIEDIKKENPEKALSLNSELITTLEVNSDALKEITKTKKKVKVKKKKEKISEEENTKTEVAQENTENTKEISKEVEVVEENSTEDQKQEEVAEEVLEENLENTEKVSEEVEDQEVVAEEIEEVIIESSLASIIIDALETETEKAERVDTEIKEKITEELDQKQEETTEVIVTEEEATQDPKTTQNQTETQETETKPEEGKDSNLEIPEVEIVNAEEVVPAPIQIEETQEKELEKAPQEEENLEELATAENTIQGEIEKEISSLEKVALAETNLNQLLLELGKERSPESNLELKELTDNEQFGKALIYIQEEINILQAEKIEKEIKTDLGIEITQETKEIESLEKSL